MRSIKFRAFINGEMIYDLAYEEYAPINDLLKGTDNLMQFTGLFDKQGVEIYEGDILKFITFGFNAESFITVIEFKNASFRLKNGRNLFYFGQTDFTKLDDCRVIGNIYENPELLEDKQ